MQARLVLSGLFQSTIICLLKVSLARIFAHLARPQIRDEHRRTVVRRASSTEREHSQGAKEPLRIYFFSISKIVQARLVLSGYEGSGNMRWF